MRRDCSDIYYKTCERESSIINSLKEDMQDAFCEIKENPIRIAGKCQN